jgi:hypothetical protein
MCMFPIAFPTFRSNGSGMKSNRIRTQIEFDWERAVGPFSHRDMAQHCRLIAVY